MKTASTYLHKTQTDNCWAAREKTYLRTSLLNVDHHIMVSLASPFHSCHTWNISWGAYVCNFSKVSEKNSLSSLRKKFSLRYSRWIRPSNDLNLFKAFSLLKLLKHDFYVSLWFINLHFSRKAKNKVSFVKLFQVVPASNST